MGSSTGISTTDILVIGGGPAGLSAAQWCAELGLSTVLLEASREFGGQLLSIYNPITNYLGREASNGRAMQELFLANVSNAGFSRLTGSAATSLDIEERIVTTQDGKKFGASAIIIATGVRRKILGVPGEEEFRRAGLLESGAKERETVTGKTVVIVGGGDAAIENALILSEFANCVLVVHRREPFTARREFLEHAQRLPNVKFLTSTIVDAIEGKQRVDSVTVKDLNSGEKRKINADAVLVRIGVKPNTDFLGGSLNLDERGYVLVNSRCETNAPGIYATGDAANPISPTIATAVGTGATAAKAAFERLRS